MKIWFRRLLLIIMMATMMICVGCNGSSDAELAADYASPREAIQAHQSGVDVTGKTVLVTAAMDETAGLIYYKPDTQIGANVYVAYIIPEGKTAPAVLEGDQVVVPISMIDDHLEKGIYIYSEVE